jgi:hypothetical protein
MLLLFVLLAGCEEGSCEPASLGANCAPVELCCAHSGEDEGDCWYRFNDLKYDCAADNSLCTQLLCDACEFGYTATDEQVCPYEQ